MLTMVIGGKIMEQLLVYGGKVWTGDSDKPFAEALLVEGNRFIAVGTLEEVRNAAKKAENKKTTELHLNGNLVMPGISDAHFHFTAFAKQNLYLDLQDIRSLDELLETIKNYARQVPAGSWIRGVRYNEMNWEKPEKLSRSVLDSLNLPHPVILSRYCGHAHVANTLALEKGGLLQSPNLSSDEMERDSSGQLTGNIFERAAMPLLRRVEEEYETPEKMQKGVAEAGFIVAKTGTTSVHASDARSYGLGEDIFAFQGLAEEGALPIRVNTYHDALPNFTFRTGFGDTWVRYGGLKVFLDGSLGGHTAALLSPYSDKADEKGILLYSDDELYNLLYDAASRSIQVQIHMIGDAAIEQGIRVVKRLLSNIEKPALPFRFNHLIVCHPEQIEELKTLPIVADIQPTQSYTDRVMAPSRLGSDRLPYLYNFRTLYETGLLLTGSSDCPMELPNSWLGIWAAVARSEMDGAPLSYLNPDETLTLEQALRIYTVNPPEAAGMGHILGKIKEGYLADFTIIDGDPFTMPVQQLKDTESLYTFVDGKLSYGNIENWPHIKDIR